METKAGRQVESVWDYPRPPRIEDDDRLVVIRHASVLLAETRRSRRVLETSHPPVFYVEPEAVNMALLQRNSKRTFCEFKGYAEYWDVTAGDPIRSVAWSYPEPSPGFESITGWLAFYPSKVSCYVGGEEVSPQEGPFYGGWITAEIEGPFKGGPGTRAW